MDSKNFMSKLSSKTGNDIKSVNKNAEALIGVIGQIVSELDTAAIPGFGAFIPIKTDEHIVENPQTGKKTLVPPSVSIEFVSSSKLKKSFNANKK